MTRDGTAETTVSRDQILRRERVQGIFILPVQLTTSRMGNLIRLILTLATVYVMTTQLEVDPNYEIQKKKNTPNLLSITVICIVNSNCWFLPTIGSYQLLVLTNNYS